MSTGGVGASDIAVELSAAHERRLRDVWRSAGWPYQDVLEAELIAAGLLARHGDPQSHELVRVTDSGVRAIAAAACRNRAARGRHEQLVAQVATDMQRAGRLVWRGLALRAPLQGPGEATRWVVAMPDVFSIRFTTLEERVEPIVHEIKVSRADLLSDLRNPDKGEAYRALAGECWYVLRDGIACADEIPPAFGVMQQSGAGLQVLRAAPRTANRLSLSTWMALAKSHAEAALEDSAQLLLGAP